MPDRPCGICQAVTRQSQPRPSEGHPEGAWRCSRCGAVTVPPKRSRFDAPLAAPGDLFGAQPTGETRPAWRPVVLDADATREATDAAIARSRDGAGADLLPLYLDAIRAVAERQAALTSDDVWAELGTAPATRAEGSALGPAFLEAERRGWVRSTGNAVRSRRPESHGNYMTVWSSLVVRERAA